MRTFSACCFALVSLAGYQTAHAEPADSAASKTVVYVGATVIDGDSTIERRNLVIRTEGNQIVAVQSTDRFHPESSSEIVDVTGQNDDVDAGVDVVSHADFLAYQLSKHIPEAFESMTALDPRAWHAQPEMTALFKRMRSRGSILDATIDVGYRHPSSKWLSDSEAFQLPSSSQCYAGVNKRKLT